MPSVLEPGKKLRRLVKVYGVEGPVELTIAHEGLSLRVPGTKKSLTCSWTDVVNASYTPNDVPSFLAGEPMKFILHEAEKVVKNRAKRAAKKM